MGGAQQLCVCCDWPVLQTDGSNTDSDWEWDTEEESQISFRAAHWQVECLRNAGSHQHSNRSWPCSGDFSLVRYYLQSYTKQLPNQVFSSCYIHLFQLIQVKEHTADNRPLPQSTSHPAPISSVKEFPPDLLAMDRHQFCEEN